jgi:hypothetical protein
MSRLLALAAAGGTPEFAGLGHSPPMIVVGARCRGCRAVARAAVVCVVALCACTGKPRAEDAARGVAARGDPAAASDGGAASDAPGDAALGARAAGDAGGVAAQGDAAGARAATGDLQVRVEWADVPVVARTSPGRTRCNTPRPPSVAPTTTWGIPGALVIVDGAGPAPAANARGGSAHIELADCALTPRVAVGDSLAITSAVDRPAKLVLRKRGTIEQLAAGPPVPVMLPIAGHTVVVALDAGAIYSVETDDAEPEAAFVAAIAGAAVTDATGHVMIRDLAAGAHAVTAWIPPRGGQPARVGRGTATVAAGDLEELTVRLTK